MTASPRRPHPDPGSTKSGSAGSACASHARAAADGQPRPPAWPGPDPAPPGRRRGHSAFSFQRDEERVRASDRGAVIDEPGQCPFHSRLERLVPVQPAIAPRRHCRRSAPAPGIRRRESFRPGAWPPGLAAAERAGEIGQRPDIVEARTIRRPRAKEDQRPTRAAVGFDRAGDIPGGGALPRTISDRRRRTLSAVRRSAATGHAAEPHAPPSGVQAAGIAAEHARDLFKAQPQCPQRNDLDGTRHSRRGRRPATPPGSGPARSGRSSHRGAAP